MSESLEQVSVESSDGRTLTGVGTTKEALTETIERHEPAKDPVTPRTDNGQFTSPDQPAQKQPRGARRIDALTGEREAERRRAEAAERERDDLRQQLEAARAPRPDVVSSSPTPTPAPSPPTPTVTRAKPTESEVGSKYENYGDFVEDLADWKAEQRLAALDFDARVRDSIEADRASRSLGDKLNTIWAEARKVYPDFDTVRTNGPGATVNFSGPKIQAILDVPHSIHAQYAIAKDRALAERLSQLGDVEFGIELMRMAPAAAVAPLASTAPASVVTAPAPYQPVGSGSATTVPPSAALIQKAGFDFDASGYRERRAAERGVTRRR